MPNPGRKHVEIERILHTKLRDLAARKGVSMQSLASEAFRKGLEIVEREIKQERMVPPTPQAFVGSAGETLVGFPGDKARPITHKDDFPIPIHKELVVNDGRYH